MPGCRSVGAQFTCPLP